MYRQSLSRSHRSKGIKVKHILQICLLLAVCFWLIYQVKHSHDKKKEYGESDDKVMHQSPSRDELMKLGRKDIRPREDAIISEKESNDEQEEEEEETTEEKYEGNKAEDEPEYKEQKEDDETDEHNQHDQEKSDVDIDREAELVDGEEREESAGNGAQETDFELVHGQRDKEISSEETNHDGDDRSVDEAREQHYKADDASSVVTHGIQTGASGNENEHVENSNDNPESILREENKENKDETNEGENRKSLEVESDQTAGGNPQFNITTSEATVDIMNTTKNGSSSNITVTEVVKNPVATNRSTVVTIENHDVLTQNVTEDEPKLESGQGNLTDGTSAEESNSQIITGKADNNTKLEPGQRSLADGTSVEESNSQIITGKVDNNTIVDVNGGHFDSNLTGLKELQVAESHIENFANSSDNNNHTEPSVSENIVTSEASVKAGNNTKSVSENNDEIEALKSDTSDAADETLESTVNKNPEDIQHDAIDISDTSNSLEENVRVDLDTLPEIQTEGSNSEEVAAE